MEKHPGEGTSQDPLSLLLDAALRAGHDETRASVLTTLHRAGLDSRVLLHDIPDEDSSLVTPLQDGNGDAGFRYQLEGEIARGGVGKILKGRDKELGRDVAIKVLLDKHADNPELVRRFVEEAQIAGQLQHPGILPVHELGIRADQRPYFTMKFVRGKTLSALLQERKSPKYDLRRFITIFHQVCQTMAYAHARGVIHRDLKPTNIMVGSFGEVHVMDWGLAKVLGQGGVAEERRHAVNAKPTVVETVRTKKPDTTASLSGSVMGTPAYMPPEQARGEVERLDRRSDVFGLGAVLCEILTGHPPYTGEDQREVRRKAERAALDDAYDHLDDFGETQFLVRLAKWCLTPDIQDRPRDAGILSDRIEKYLASLDARARKAEVKAAEAQVRADSEHKTKKLALGLAASVFVLAVGGTAWLFKNQADHLHQIELESQIAGDLNRLEGLYELAEGDAGLDLQTWRSLSAELALVSARVEAIAVASQLGTRMDELAGKVREGEELVTARFERRARDTAMVERLLQIALISPDDEEELHDYSPRDEEYRLAFSDYGIAVEELPPERAASRIREQVIANELIDALDDWALACREAEEGDDWKELLRVSALADRDPWRTRLRRILLAEGEDRVLQDLAVEADVKSTLPGAIMFLAKELVARGLWESARQFLKRGRWEHPSNFRLAMYASWAFENAPPSDHDSRLSAAVAATTLRPESARAWIRLGEARSRMNSPTEAERAWRRASALDPDDVHAAGHLAQLSIERGDVEEGIAQLQALVQGNPDSCSARDLLGRAYARLRDYDKATDLIREAIQMSPEEFQHFNNLGVVLVEVRDLEGAIQAYQRALEIAPTRAGIHSNLGVALAKQNRLEEAEAEHRKAIGLDPGRAASHNNLGDTLSLQGRHEESEAAHRRATQLDPRNASFHTNLGVTLRSQNRLDEAEEAYAKAMDLDPEYALAHSGMGSLLAQRGFLSEGIQSYRKALRLEPENPRIINGLGIALSDKGDLEGALAEFQRAVSIDNKYAPALNNWGFALSSLGDLRGAFEKYQAAVDLDPYESVYASNLGSWYLVTGDYGAALRVLSEAKVRFPRGGYLYENLGRVYIDLGDYNEALANLNRRAPYDDGLTGRYLFLRGQARRRLKRHEDAIQAFRQSQELFDAAGVGIRYPTAQWMARTERFRDGEGAIRIVMESREPSGMPEMLLDAAYLAGDHRDYERAADLFATAFSAAPMLLDEVEDQYGYEAAVIALYAADRWAPVGAEIAESDPRRQELRAMAHDWLMRQLEGWRARVETLSEGDAVSVVSLMRDWSEVIAGLLHDSRTGPRSVAEDASWGELWKAMDRVLEVVRNK